MTCTCSSLLWSHDVFCVLEILMAGVSWDHKFTQHCLLYTVNCVTILFLTIFKKKKLNFLAALSSSWSLVVGPSVGPSGYVCEKVIFRVSNESEGVTEWVSDWVIEWLSDWVTEWLSDWVTEWLSDWVTERLSDWVTKWLSDWVTKWLKFCYWL